MRWITALNLQTWADTDRARDIFPGMVADLIWATAQDISKIRFPNGDKGQVRGFDGVLEAVCMPPYVPDGRSIWEFGVNADAAGKANSDFLKRTKEVHEAQRIQTTFVFATPRTWNKANEKIEDWVDAKRKRGQWKDVVYLDGSMVEDWLSRSPAVAARYARSVLEISPSTGARSTDEFWEEYSTRFDPPLVEQVLLAGREKQAEALIGKLSKGVSKILYAADTPDEVVAFTVAAIRSSDPADRCFLEAKTIVVDTEDAARQLAGTSGLAFLPRAQARGMAGYLAQKGPTVVGAGADDKKHDHEILRRPSSDELGKALSEMGSTELEEGYDLARRCGRSLAVLARLKPSGTAPKPEWMESGTLLLPALLAGAWCVTAKSDREVLCSLAAAKDYTAFEAPLRTLAKLQDPPIEYVVDVWALRASVDAFVHLGPLIGPEHLARFFEAAKTVFCKAMEPPKAEDIFIPATHRAVDSHSGWLRNGMMNMLLHMAVLHEQAEFSVAGSTPQRYVDSVVRAILGLSSEHRLLASLQGQMARLAEAAPIPFVEAIERLLKGDAAGIRPLFKEYESRTGAHSLYGVLQGLELLAWDPQSLLRVSLCLARLAEIDPGGSSSDRPINSLQAIFRCRAPNTNATAKQRMDVLTCVLDKVPSIARSLITKLLPSAHVISFRTQRPAFREFGERSAEVLTNGVVWESEAFVVDIAICQAGKDPERWVTLIEAIGHFPEQVFNGVAKALEGVLASATTDARLGVWDALCKQVNRHRTNGGMDWALSEDALSKLDVLVETFVPPGAVARVKWLFDDGVHDVPRKAEVNGALVDIFTARFDAIRQVLDESGTAGLIDLAVKVKLPLEVALAARGLCPSSKHLAQLAA